MLKLKELYLKNFRSWEELHITDFDSKGLCGIQGSNGVGKSSIRQAIEYLLSDRIAEGLSVEDLPRNKTSSCELRCLIDRDGDLIEIVKYRSHDEFGNQTKLMINGDNSLTSNDRRITQKTIEELLGINKDSIFASTSFSQYSKSFVEARDTERKSLLYYFLNLSEYNTYLDSAKKACEDLKETIENIERSLKTDSDSLRSESNTLDLLRTKFDRFEEDCKVKIEGFKSKKIQLQSKSDSSKERLTELKTLINSIKDELIEIDEESINDKRIKLSKLSSDMNLFSFKRKNIEGIISEKKRDIENKINICPILKMKCTDLIEQNNNVEKQISKEIELLVVESGKLLSDEERLKVLVSEKTTCLEKLAISQKLNSKILDRIKYIERDVYKVESELEATIREITSLDSRIQEEKDKVNSENPYQDLITRSENFISKLEAIIEDNNIELAHSINLLPYYEFWATGFSRSGIPNMKMESALDDIEFLTNRFLSEMSKDMAVSIDSQRELQSGEVREAISYNVVCGNKPITDFWSFSGGEKHRIKIADLFAFATLLGKFNFLILDEVLELSLDDLGKEQIINFLKERAKELGSIFVISHSNIIKDKFDTVITVTKKNGVSEVE